MRSLLAGMAITGLAIAASIGSAAATPEAALIAPAPDGAALYQEHCEQCHGGKVSKAPQLSLLQIMSAGSILRAMESGVMQEQAAALDGEQRRALAEHLTGQSVDLGHGETAILRKVGFLLDKGRSHYTD